MPTPRRVAAVVFDGFEVLDLFGPIELLAALPDAFSVEIVAARTGPIMSAQGVSAVATRAFSESRDYDVLLVPGGRGTRVEVDNPVMLEWLQTAATEAEYITSVCTGSALLAAAGLLDGHRATSNKQAFEWVTTQGERVDWVYQARWVADGTRFTASGVSAGMDMTLALIERILGPAAREHVARYAEYTWHSDSTQDPFAV